MADSAPRHVTSVRYLQHLTDRLQPGARVLDLGCDRWTSLVERAFALTGVDLCLQQLRRSRHVLPRARVVQADMTRLALPSLAIDPVVSLYVFNHPPFGELAPLLTRIAGWLKPDWLGVLMYFTGDEVDASKGFVRAGGLWIEVARVETVWETLAGQTKPVEFLLVLAQRP